MAHTRRDQMDPNFGPKDYYGGSSTRHSARQEIEEELALWEMGISGETQSTGMFEREQHPTLDPLFTHQDGNETSLDSSIFWSHEGS
jgi:hypothetical protein